ncbi:ankyrin repeat-containing domain protein [Tricladium varicosporioides]|nr:ankyrin repeat-containing domain protein [Hymenoscyphus varicosporioides]
MRWLGGKRGLLWIKGKPGSGKSTLMAFIYRELQKTPPSNRSVTLDFFFHGRGTFLQKTSIGMFRSLLHQIYDKVPSVRSPILAAFSEKEKLGEAGSGWQWQCKELEDLFSHAVIHAAKSKIVTIFVDALDEAGVDTARELAEYFQVLNNRPAVGMNKTKICISCRHYPIVTLAGDTSLDIHVEDENKEDISVYVHDKLHNSLGTSEFKEQYLAELQNTIVKRAQGVFQWAVLVVRLMIKYHNKGCSTKEIRQLLDEVPEALGKVYEHILRKVIDKKDYPLTLRLMRWVCLAEWPLTMTDIRFGMCLPEKEIFSSEYSLAGLELQPEEKMIKRISSLSGGLIESRQHESSQIVQFIHQSVNDFLLQGGLQIFDKTTTTDLIGQGHHQLSLICANYMRIAEMDSSNDSNAEAIKAMFPFVDYVVKSWFLHAEKAETRGITQDYLLRYAHYYPNMLERWARFYRILDSGNYSGRRPQESITMLHIASSAGLLSVVNSLLLTYSNIEQTDSSGNRALHYASRRGYAQVVQALLNAGADFKAENRKNCTALELAAANGHEEIVRLLLSRGANVNKQTGRTGDALYRATMKGSIAIVQLLINSQTDVNAQGGRYGNALQAAAYRGYQHIVQLLLDKQADVNAQGGDFGNALQAAAFGGHQPIVQLLLDKQADVNAQGGEYGHALQAAAFGGYQSIVQLLLDKQADANAQGGYFGNALQAAALGGRQPIVQLLLNKQVDVNIKGGHFSNALQAAAYGGHQSTVQLLLDKHADVNAQGGEFSNALQAAAYGGYQSIVQLLLDKQADVNAQGGHFNNALQAATIQGHQSIVQLLLDKQADVNAQGGLYSNALQIAAFRGYQHIVQLLLDKQADVNAQGGAYGNALQAAAYGGYQSIVQLLLDKQADVNAQGGRYGNALQAAVFRGHQLTVQFLLDNQANIFNQDKQGRYVIHLALRGGHHELTALILSTIKTVDWNYQDLQGCFPLHFAASGASDQIIQLILESKVDINTVDTYG